MLRRDPSRVPVSPLGEVLEEFSEQALASLEARHDAENDRERRIELERAGRLAAQIEIDINDHGPLARYVAARRGEALAAIQVLRTTDPRDGVSIARIQSEIEEYLRARDWIVGAMNAAEEAAQIIEEEYGNSHDPHDDRYHG
jgi:hypothetical protein